MRIISPILICLLLLMGLASTPHAVTTGQSDVVVTDAVASQLTASHLAIAPGQTFTIAWHVRLEPEWHIYWQNPGDSGLPPKLRLYDPTFTRGELQFPSPKVIRLPPITNYGYENEVVFTVPVTAPKILPAGEKKLSVRLEYLYCKDVCLPGEVDVTLPLNVAAAPVANPLFAPLANAHTSTLPKVMDGTMVHAYRSGDSTYLVIDSSAAENGKKLHFIPWEDGWLDDSAPQQASWNNEFAELALHHDPHASTFPSTLRGLILTDGGAWKINIPLGNAPMTSEEESSALPLILFFAFLAGLILNLMPCVLPIISLKVFALVRTHRGRERILHSLVYAGGVLVCLWGLAMVVAILQEGGRQIGWGFQMQSPHFVALLALVMTLLALNFWGVFTPGGWLTRLSLPQRGSVETYADAFLTGLLAVIVATPCTVPFMGSAMAYALGQPFAASLLVFSALGLGMAAPLIAVAAFPPMARILPRPGAWMNTFKQVLGWPMLATALWLLWVFGKQTDMDAVAMLLLVLMLVSLTTWVASSSGSKRWPTLVLVAASLLAGWQLYAALQPPSVKEEQAASVWQPWSRGAVEVARGKGPVFVDFTADWCITCKFTEATVLNTEETQKLFQAHNVTLLVADWTKQNQTITAELERHGRRGVPLYLLYLPGNEEPLILPQLVTHGLLEELLTAVATSPSTPQ